MVNIRASLAKARSAQLFAPSEETVLTNCAKSLFYKDRNWERILRVGLEAGVSSRKIERLSLWLSKNEVDVKRQDAKLLLAALKEHKDFRAECGSILEFPNTLYWKDLYRQITMTPEGARATRRRAKLS